MCVLGDLLVLTVLLPSLPPSLLCTVVVIQWVGGLMGFYQDDARGRWIDGATVSYDNWQPGINAPCPGAYQPMGKCWRVTSCVCVWHDVV